MSWNGPQCTAKIQDALRRGIDKTTSDGAIEAKRLVNVDTTLLQGSIYPEPAKIESDGSVAGVYGPHDISYAVEQEFLLGESLPDGGTRQRKGGKPYMRPSMAKAADELPGNIVKAYRGGI